MNDIGDSGKDGNHEPSGYRGLRHERGRELESRAVTSPEPYGQHREWPDAVRQQWSYDAIADSVSEAINYSAFFRTLWRRKFLFGSVAAVFICAIAAIIVRMPPHYVAHAFVAIGDPLAKSRLPYGANQSAMGAVATLPDAGTVQTEVEVLKSPQLALEVVRDLKLADNPEFNPAALSPPQPGFMSQLKAWLFGVRPTPPTLDAAAELSRTTETFLGRLRVSAKDNSRMLDIAFDSMEPHLAMQIANSLVDHYVDSQLEVRTQSAQRTSAWLREKIAQLQTKVEEAEKAVERFRSQAGLFSTPGGSPLLLKQMTDVSAELANAQTARAALQARLAHLRASVEAKGRGGSPVDIVDSPFMKTLDDQQADAEQKLAEASASLGDKNPATLGLREKLRHIQAAKRNEGLRVTASIESDLKIAQMKERDLTERVNRLQTDVADMNRSEITLRALEREAQADRLVLNNFIGRFKETSQESDVSSQRPDARIVSYAQLPVSPDRPKKELLLLIAGVASLIGSALLVLFVERADRSMHNAEEVEQFLKIPVLGMLPVSKAVGISPTEAARYGYSYREELKAAYSRLFWTRTPPKVTVVTSALPSEGKTTFALGLAAIAAQSGQRVIVVDADFWKMGASLKMGIRSELGLAELLEGRCVLANTIVSDVVSGADIMPPGKFSRASLLAWVGKLPVVLENLVKQYDVIIVDAPPVLSVAEATLLAAHADATVVAVRWGSTSRDAVKLALKRLKQSGSFVIGSVITMVEQKQSAMYGYAEAAYFSNKLGSYNPASGAVTYSSDATDAAGGRVVSGLARAQSHLLALATRLLGAKGPAVASMLRRVSLLRQLTMHAPPSLLPKLVDEVEASHPTEPGSSHYALLIVDVQEIFGGDSDRKSPPAQTYDRLIQTINRVSCSASVFKMTVLYAHQHKEGSRTERLSRLLTKNLRRRALHARAGERLKVVSGYSFLKPSEDAFSNTQLDGFLRQNGIEHLFIAGLDGATSISKTARSALKLGYRVTFIRDGIFTAFGNKWDRLLKAFESSAAFAITSEEFGDLRWRFSKQAKLNQRAS